MERERSAVQCSARGIGEREAEEAEEAGVRERERVIELLSLLPPGLYFTLGLPSCAPWRTQPKTRRKKRRSEVK